MHKTLNGHKPQSSSNGFGSYWEISLRCCSYVSKLRVQITLLALCWKVGTIHKIQHNACFSCFTSSCLLCWDSCCATARWKLTTSSKREPSAPGDVPACTTTGSRDSAKYEEIKCSLVCACHSCFLVRTYQRCILYKNTLFLLEFSTT